MIWGTERCCQFFYAAGHHRLCAGVLTDVAMVYYSRGLYRAAASLLHCALPSFNEWSVTSAPLFAILAQVASSEWLQCFFIQLPSPVCIRGGRP
jgi:hypothetical protein